MCVPGIAELGCTGTTYVRNVLVPYPGGVGAGQQPSLLSAVGDGVNVLGARSGPTIANNTMRACASFAVTSKHSCKGQPHCMLFSLQSSEAWVLKLTLSRQCGQIKSEASLRRHAWRAG